MDKPEGEQACIQASEQACNLSGKMNFMQTDK
jgi:hypothetical protein